MNLRKKISLKGVLLALAISMPPLISTTVFTVQNQPLNNQSITLFDNDKTFTSLSEPYSEVKQNSLIVNDDLIQTVPFKVSISYIKPFKWVNYRTRSEIEAKIHDLIVLNTRQELIELNKDYEIDFVTNIASDEAVPIQTVKVKAIADSQYLTGEFSFEIIAPLKLTKNNFFYNKPITQNFYEELFIKNVLKEEIGQEMLKQNIDESTDDVLALLNIVPTNVTNGSTVFANKHNGETYYKKIVFQFLPNKLFSSDLITWNIAAPYYTNDEIPGLSINKAASLSFVDTTYDEKYPHATDPDAYINSNHVPSRRTWQYSPTIIFATIDVKTMFNFNSNKEFFELYQLTFTYSYILNLWSNKLGWNNPNAKQEKYNVDEATLALATVPIIGLPILRNKTNSLGDLNSKWKAVAETTVFIEEFSPTVFQIKGRTGTVYNWNDGSVINNAAFALLRASSLKIEQIPFSEFPS